MFLYDYMECNGIASGSLAEWNVMECNVMEWNRERQRGGMESRAAVSRNGM